ncbi:uncharacterized protein BJ171DRAFT_55321 [Polychytrium aggregatum]|uniref:uncharacterized protein n=1 Tax=Polychytrium aggregatum TaxID=110093 RepID=UPI0022FE1E21|nr:uncharacterized protein BJ171DRAFT_55321 [Polychytrium aggregatum]KAI9205938.1 hypothetical protein BJ171DRAFT_55321 [Polychytrium aggregatum]
MYLSLLFLLILIASSEACEERFSPLSALGGPRVHLGSASVLPRLRTPTLLLLPYCRMLLISSLFMPSRSPHRLSFFPADPLLPSSRRFPFSPIPSSLTIDSPTSSPPPISASIVTLVHTIAQTHTLPYRASLAPQRTSPHNTVSPYPLCRLFVQAMSFAIQMFAPPPLIRPSLDHINVCFALFESL